MLILVSGPVGSGKTTLCARAAAAACARGVDVSGVLAPPMDADTDGNGPLVSSVSVIIIVVSYGHKISQAQLFQA